jgi:hypothetical protein
MPKGVGYGKASKASTSVKRKPKFEDYEITNAANTLREAETMRESNSLLFDAAMLELKRQRDGAQKALDRRGGKKNA